MQTRCKFKCVSVKQDQAGFSYAFEPVTSGSKENEAFFKYTPSGGMSFGTTEERKFEPGKEYYIDISEVQ
jgi:hypothetical protein